MVRAGWKLPLPSGLLCLWRLLCPLSMPLVHVAQYMYVRRMADEKKDQRIPIMMTASEVGRVDEWRRNQPDLPSRAEAIRRLIEIGLDMNAANYTPGFKRSGVSYHQDPKNYG